jgi:signal peptide peptidase SppA
MIAELDQDFAVRAPELPRIAARILNAPLLITPGAAAAVVSGLADRLGVLPLRKATSLAAIDRRSQSGGEAPYAVADGVATIPLLGETINRGSWVSAQSGVTSYETVQRALRRAEADPTVTGILLDVDSPGGEAAGAMEAADVVRAVAAKKPIVAYVNGLAASAAYAIAAGALEIVAAPSATLGSIGVVYLHIDRSKAMDHAGLKPTLIHAGARKVDGNSLRPLDASARAAIQRQIDDVYALLVGSVGKHRPRLGESGARLTDGAIYFGQKAVDAGLADRIGTMGDALDALRLFPASHVAANPSGAASDLPPAAPLASHPSSQAGEAVPLFERARAAAQAAGCGADEAEIYIADSVANAREKTIARARACGVPEDRLEKVADEAEKGDVWARAALICFSNAATGRCRLVEHLIFNTDLSAEAAVTVLRGAPMEEARSPGAENRATRKHVFYSTAEFDEAMRRGEIKSGDQTTIRHPSQRGKST